MSSPKFNTPSPVRTNSGNMSPLTAKPMPPSNSYNKENLTGRDNPQTPSSKVYHRLSLPMGLNNVESSSPFKSRKQAASGSGPRRGRVTDGGATSSLTATRAGGASETRTPEKRLASVAELDDTQSAAKRPRTDIGESPSHFNDRALTSEGIKVHGNIGAPAAKSLDGTPRAAPVLRDHGRELLEVPEYPSVDAQYEAIWDAATKSAGEASKDGYLADELDNEDAFGAWHELLLNREDERRQRRVEQSLRRSGDSNTIKGDLLQEENRVDALGAPAVPGSNDFEALLPVPLALALRAGRGLADCAEHHLLVPKVPIMQQAAPALPVVPAAELPRAASLPPPEVPEHEDARDPLPTVEEDAVAAPEVPQATLTKPVEVGRKSRAARVRSQARLPQAPSTPLPAPASREVTPYLPQSSNAQVPQADRAKSTGRRTRSTRAQSNAPEQGALTSPSPLPLTLELIPEAPQPPRANGAKSGGAKKPTCRKRGSQAPSNESLGSSIAGPSNSTSATQDLYSPALAQQIWDLSEAGKWRKALSLFVPAEEVMHIVGEAKVRAYLRDHPGAAHGLRPLKDGKKRQELFVCRSKTFWVPIKRKKGQAEGPRQFLLQHHAEDCVKGYTTPDNYNKHVYRNHLQKKYKSYAKEDGEEGRTTSVKGKGKARQATKKSKIPEKEEDEDEDEDEDGESNED